jgi:FkbM family methyltransferase
VLAAWVVNSTTGRLADRLLTDTVKSHGVEVDLPRDVVQSAERLRVRLGMYESAELRLLEKHLPSNIDIVELGSSSGISASHIARRLSAGHRLICVEPDPSLLRVCRANVERHASHLSWDVVWGAIDGDARSHETRFVVGHSSVTGRLATSHEAAIKVPRLSLSQLLSTHGIGRFGLVMDIEGAEASLLWNDNDALVSCSFVMTELHGWRCAQRLGSTEELRDRFWELGFRERDRDGNAYVYVRPAS